MINLRQAAVRPLCCTLLLLLVLLPSGSPRADGNNAPGVVILMIADGWGYHQIEAADYYRFGEAGSQCYEQFPVRLAMSTYPAGGSYDAQAMWSDADWCLQEPTDSAAAATAMACGVKTDNGVLGLDPAGNRLELVTELAARRGMRTGVVTSVPFCHATPAAFAAHHNARGDYNIIAHQMLAQSPLNLIMGAGNPLYDHLAQPRSEPDFSYISAEDWQLLQEGSLGNDIDGDGLGDNWELVTDLEGFAQLARQGAAGRILGLPRASLSLQWMRPRASERPFADPLNEGVPDLATMSLGALNCLAGSRAGCFLMIEGGAVDAAGHSNEEHRLIEEMQDFNYAVDCVSAWIENTVGWDECLLVVTGDHECGYLCGPGEDRLHGPIVNHGQGILPGMLFTSGGHTNQLIPLYAKGRGAELLLPLANETDPVRGAYLDNAELGQFLLRMVDSR